MAKGFSMFIFSTYGFCHAVPRVFQSIRVEFRAHSWCLCADLKSTIVKQCLKQVLYFTTCLEAYSGGWCRAQCLPDVIYTRHHGRPEISGPVSKLPEFPVKNCTSPEFRVHN